MNDIFTRKLLLDENDTDFNVIQGQICVSKGQSVTVVYVAMAGLRTESEEG